MSLRNKLLGAFAALTVLSAGTASAHRVGVVLTTIEPNPRSGKWEVVHRLPAHELDHFLLRLGIEPETFYTTPDGQQALAAFVTERYRISGDKSAISLSYVGVETELDWIWVYFEFDSPVQPVRIDNRMFIGESQFGEHAITNVKSLDGVEKTLLAVPGGQPGAAMLCIEDCSKKR